MGSSQSTPFNYDKQLLSDTTHKYTVEVKSDETNNGTSTAPHRNASTADRLISIPFEDEVKAGTETARRTIWECFQRGVEKYAENPCLGTRVFEVQDGAYVMAKDKAAQRNDFIWETYKETDAQARALGAGLIALGAKAQDNVGIFSANRAEWVKSMLALFSQNLRCVSLYATLGDEAVEYIIGHADIKIVFVAKENIAELLKSAKKLPNLTTIIQYDVHTPYNNIGDNIDEKHKTAFQELNMQLLGIHEVQQLGTEKGIFPNPAGPEDFGYIMYTSGTTGNPKGVLLKHSSIVAAMSGSRYVFEIGTTDVHLSYLPLAHIFESLVLTAMLLFGARIGFFQNNIKRLTDDLVTLKPTFMVGVPRVFQRIYQTVYNRLGDAGCVKKWYFNRAFNYQCECIRQGTPRSDAYDARVFSKIRETVGLSRCRFILSGAAPLPPFLNEFLKVVVGCPVIQGYGLTETSAGSSCARQEDVNVGHVGAMIPCCEIKLADIPDMGYTCQDKPYQRGEILIRGPSVFSGYYKDEVNTAAVMTADGWFCTGDVGRWNPNGSLSIIDRKKNMFKLSQGEYIAVEKIENVYAKSGVVGQLFVYGNSFKSFVLAVVVPSADNICPWLVSQGYWTVGNAESARVGADNFPENFEKVINGPHADAIKAHIVASLKEQDKSLKGFEKIVDVIVEGRVNAMGMGFTEQNNCLTPTFKLRRQQLLQRYITQLKELYTKNGEPPAPDEKWPGEE